MPPKTKSAQEHSALFTTRQRNIAFIIVAFAFVMDLLDSTIVNIAIPTIQQNLGASYAAIQWLIAGYSLTFALLLITGGRMGDVYGYKKLFMVGVAGFTLASLLCGVSVSPTMLIVARLIQGSMAALMVPQVMSLIQVMFKPEERGAINGMFGALGGAAASLGPVIGGLLIKANVANLDWRPIFLINVPVGIFALIMALKYLPDGKSAHPLKLDLVGTGIVVVGMTLLIYPLIQGRELGWPHWTYAMIIASIPVFLLFAKWQRIKDARDGSPLVVPALFKVRSFTVGLLINTIFPAAMLGFFLTFTLVLQIGLGFSAIHAALTGLPVAFGIAMTMATMGEKVIPKLGRRALQIGAVVMACGLALTNLIFHHYGQGIHSWQLIPGLILVGIGMGFVFASMFAAVMNGVDVKHAGAASGTMNAVSQVGSAIGIALIGVVFFGQISHGAASSFDTTAPQLRSQLTSYNLPVEAQDAIVSSTKQCYVDRSIEKDNTVVPASCKQSAGTPGTDARIGKAIAGTAMTANDTNFNKAFKHAIIFETVVLAAVLALSFLLPKHFRTEAYQPAA
jgi:EmrB/QacA subfamily drug resistance transporter